PNHEKVNAMKQMNRDVIDIDDFLALPVHPAAELIPRVPPEELKKWGDNILKNGLADPVHTLNGRLVDGLNRPEAIKSIADELRNHRVYRRLPVIRHEWETLGGGQSAQDALDIDQGIKLVTSLNLLRRQLNAEQTRELIRKLLRLKPGQSNRQVAE